ncbi:MAG: hypothetical protein ISR55_10730 [Bacteroidetes bacterium]|nr:hypothetical protein [Bacteroidota bacterium]
MRKQFFTYYLQPLFAILLVCIFCSCNDEIPESKPTITITVPNTRAPLYYNLDTMFLIGSINDKEIIKKVEYRMEDKNMQVVYSKSFTPNSTAFAINDSLPLIVTDHTNYIFYIIATNESLTRGEYSLFIHVMP